MDQHRTAKIMFVIFIVFIIVSAISAEDTYLPSTESQLPRVEVYTPPTVNEDKGYYPTQTTPDSSKIWDYRAPTYDIYNYDRAPVE